LILAGRGFGKTRAGSEWVRAQVEQHGARRIALVARTAADARDVMVEGESGILATSPSWNRPLYEPSKRKLSWANGTIGTLYSAEEPDLLRGPQFDTAWADEIATWLRATETWDNLTLALRLGARPRACVTTTPRPIPIIRALLAAPSTVTTRGSTFDNAINLAPSVLNEYRARYSGTRIGRQELHAEVLTDTPGALFTRDLIDKARVRAAPELVRIVVAIDPSVTAGPDSDLAGIIVSGRAANGELYVLEDASLRASPDQWARRAVVMFDKWQADAIVVETNQGGDLLSGLLNSVRPGLRIVQVHAKRGKQLRAEGPAALYEQGKVHHVSPAELRDDPFAALEEQMCSWTPGEGSSPDRLDALVYSLLELAATLAGAGFLEFARREVERLNGQPAAMAAETVRMRAPADTADVYNIDGVRVTPDSQGLVDVPAARVHLARSIGFRTA
jgi:phage terminase large subunit-like protein